MLQINDLYDYKNRMIYQDSDYFKFSIDSILLAEYARSMSDKKVILDLCTGNCAIPLICSTYNNSKYVSFEITKEIYELGKKSIEYNKLDNQIEIINDDINNIDKYFSSETFDYILCNPPYFKFNDNSQINDNYIKSLARHEIKLKLGDIFKISYKMLKNKGSLYIVHRVDRLDDILYFSRLNNLNVKNIQLVSTKKDNIPNIVLCRFVKNGGSGVKFNKVINVENEITYQRIFEEIK